MLHFFFIRHAQSSNNVLWDTTRSSNGRRADPELSQLGLRQAERLAQFLKEGSPDGGIFDPAHPVGFGLTHLYCSLMVRAVATGTVVARTLGLPLVAWEDLHEEGGIYLENEAGERVGQAGHTRDFFARNYPELILPAEFPAAGWWNNRPYEAEADRPLRARRVLATLLKRHGGSDDRVAIFSHGGFYNWFMKAILGDPAAPEVWFRLNNTAITRIHFFDHAAEIVYMNNTGFLSADLVT